LEAASPPTAPDSFAPSAAAQPAAEGGNQELGYRPAVPAELPPATDTRSRQLAWAQRARRHVEWQVRHAAVRCAADGQRQRQSVSSTARQLGVRERTLRHWMAKRPSLPVARGRPTLGCPVAVRNEVYRWLRDVTGPVVGRAALQALFPHVPRVVLASLLKRYRRVWKWRYRRRGFRLEWLRPGTVWAIDFSEARYPIDGIGDYLFAVRDLASHCQLAWLPFRTQTAQEAMLALERLFLEFGPPLVLKSDNGSAFIAELFEQFLAQHQVVQLLSPARYPQFNGALERSNGTLKTYTDQDAHQQGHPLRWTGDNLAQARTLANTLTRPWGRRGASPREAWEQRGLITPEERAMFLETLARHRTSAQQEMALGLTPELRNARQQRADRTRIERLAITETLVELNYLTMARVPRPAKRPKRRSRAQMAERIAKHAPQLAKPAGKVEVAIDEAAVWPCQPNPPAGPPSAAANGWPTAPRADGCESVSPMASGSLSETSAKCDRSGSRQAAENSGPPADGIAPAENAPKLLATLTPRVIMPEPYGSVDRPVVAAPTPLPAHGGQAYTSWLRRSITLILAIARSAIIS
jgi:transposase InsO family protein